MDLEALLAVIADARKRYGTLRHDRPSAPAEAVLQELAAILEDLLAASEGIDPGADHRALPGEVEASVTRRFRDHFELAPLPYLVTDRSGRILEANPAAEALFGRTGRALAQLPIVSLAGAREQSRLRARIAAMRDEPASAAARWDLRLRHASRGPFEATVSVSREDRPGEQAGELRWIVLPRPAPDPARQLAERPEAMVAELRQAREPADEDEVARLGDLAHEIRNSMHALLGAAAIVEETELSAEQAEYVAMIERTGKNVLEIVGGALELAEKRAARGRSSAAPPSSAARAR
jgi:PAS domain S-box-containing protein